jgi:hypothetical protein
MKTLLKSIKHRISGQRTTVKAPVSANAFLSEHYQWYLPSLAGPRTFLPSCVGADPVRKARRLMDTLSPDDFLEFIKNFYDAGLARFGNDWEYADINTFLVGISNLLKPESYLEIGVRRGRSACMVASESPDVHIVGFDMWIENYAGMPNPGEDMVRSELKQVGHRGIVEFYSGDSKLTVPKYFENNPNNFFDLVTVDGDHSVRGARLDLENVIPHIKVGGVLIFDDTCNQDHPGLYELWRSLIENNPLFASYTYNDVGFGVAMAVRKA